MHLTTFQCVCIVIGFIWVGLSLYCIRKVQQAFFKPDMYLDAFIAKLDKKNEKGEFEKYVKEKKIYYAKFFVLAAFFAVLFFAMGFIA
ncbi:MAG: hypothetical protein IKO42_03650 [Opitutales bacterium]|nr:hypothetical protein [Opitutales bacterium]